MVNVASKSAKGGIFNTLFHRNNRASPSGFAKMNKRDRSIIDLIGFRACSPDGILYATDGTVARYLKVKSTDLFDLDDQTRLKYMDAFTNFNRTYTLDYKIVTLSSRIDTTEQQLYWRHLRERMHSGTTKQDAIRRRLINEYLAKVISLERNADAYSEVQFYILIFAKNTKNLKLNTRSARIAEQGMLGLEPLNYDETCDVLFRLNNLNSK